MPTEWTSYFCAPGGLALLFREASSPEIGALRQPKFVSPKYAYLSDSLHLSIFYTGVFGAKLATKGSTSVR